MKKNWYCSTDLLTLYGIIESEWPQVWSSVTATYAYLWKATLFRFKNWFSIFCNTLTLSPICECSKIWSSVTAKCVFLQEMERTEQKIKAQEERKEPKQFLKSFKACILSNFVEKYLVEVAPTPIQFYLDNCQAFQKSFWMIPSSNLMVESW